MAQLQYLPRELLDIIFRPLCAKRTSRYGELRSMSLVCKRILPAAQTALFHRVVITAPKGEDRPNATDYQRGGWSSLGCLVRTLLSRPDLARQVRHLTMSITKRTIGHHDECDLYRFDLNKEYCKYDWDDTAKLREKFLKRMRFFTGLAFQDPTWTKAIRDGEQLAVFFVVLAALPNLQTLTANRLPGQVVLEDHREMRPMHLEPDVAMSFRRMFGNLTRHPSFDISWIRGFANIEKLTANCLLPPEMIGLPKLTEVSFGLQDRLLDFVPDWIKVSEPLLSNYVSSSVRRLKITLDIDSLNPVILLHHNALYEYGQKLPSYLPTVQPLDIIVRPVFCDDTWSEPSWRIGNFQSLIKKLEGKNIEILKIDTSELADAETAFYDYDSEEPFDYDSWDRSYHPIRWAMSMWPTLSLSSFPKLRKFVAALEAFFGVDEYLLFCELPSTIEELGIIDTTCAVLWYFKHLVDEKAVHRRLPNLKLITLWKKDSPWLPLEDHLEWDQRLGKQSNYPYDGATVKDSHVKNEKSDNDAKLRGYSPPEWKRQTVAATRDEGMFGRLAGIGIEVKQKYYSESGGWTDL